MNNEKSKLDAALKISVIVGILVVSTALVYFFVVKSNEEISGTQAIEQELQEVLADGLKDARAIGRDSRRISNVKALQVELELYADMHDFLYPETLADLLESGDYIQNLLDYPEVASGSECASDKGYGYEAASDRQSYTLSVCLETGEIDNYEKGVNVIDTF